MSERFEEVKNALQCRDLFVSDEAVLRSIAQSLGVTLAERTSPAALQPLACLCVSYCTHECYPNTPLRPGRFCKQSRAQQTMIPTHFAFLWQRKKDTTPWPSIYTDRRLAEENPHRVSEVVPVVLKVR